MQVVRVIPVLGRSYKNGIQIALSIRCTWPVYRCLQDSSDCVRRKHVDKIKTASRNVRSMSRVLGDTRLRQRSAIIANTLNRSDITAEDLQETRLEFTRELREITHTFFWAGVTTGEGRNAGIAYAMGKKSLIAKSNIQYLLLVELFVLCLRISPTYLIKWHQHLRLDCMRNSCGRKPSRKI